MPMYRTALGIVHMRGTRLPAPCGAEILLAGKVVPCLAISEYLCDGAAPPSRPGEDQKKGTCDKPLCTAHTKQIGKNKHLCPSCFQAQENAQQQRSLFTSIVK